MRTELSILQNKNFRVTFQKEQECVELTSVVGLAAAAAAVRAVPFIDAGGTFLFIKMCTIPPSE